MIGRLATISAVVATAILALIAARAGGGAAYANESLPRWVVLAGLYGSTAVIGGLGAAFHRPELLASAGALYVPGSILSFGGATFMFIVPSALYLAAAYSDAGGGSLLPRDPARAALTVIAASLGGLVLLMILGVVGFAGVLGLLALAVTIENRGLARPSARPALVTVGIVGAILAAGLISLNGDHLPASILIAGAVALAIASVALGDGRGPTSEPPRAAA